MGIRHIGNYHLFSMISVLILTGATYLITSCSIAHATEEDRPPDLAKAVDRVVKQNGPAVVHVEVVSRENARFPSWIYENGQLFDMSKRPHSIKLNWQNRGIGLLVDGQGHILTNYQIVGGATEIHVFQVDGARFYANLVGIDPETDLAVIRLLVHQSISYATFGDSDKVDIGDRVIIIGYQNSLNHTVCHGVIHAVPRPAIKGLHPFEDLIQTDAPIPADNTGGPLLNLKGEVVGIHSALITRLSGVEGVCFAIPSNVAVQVAKQLIENETVGRGWLGANVRDITPDIAKYMDLQRSAGALITHVVKGGPADRAGLKAGDVVTGFRDKEVPSGEYLQGEVAASTVGEKVDLTIFRNKDMQRVSLVIGNLEEMINDPAFFIRSRLGVEVRSATLPDVKRYGLDTRRGVVVIGVYPDSPLFKVGFEVNDMIIEVEGQAVKGLHHFTDQVIRLRRNQRVIMLGLDHRTGKAGYVQVVVP